MIHGTQMEGAVQIQGHMGEVGSNLNSLLELHLLQPQDTSSSSLQKSS
jgi:hypothetical protein